MIYRVSTFLLLSLFTFLFFSNCSTPPSEVPVLKIGHVGHDHHTALYVAALNGEMFKADYNFYLKEVRPKQLYDLYDDGERICQLELFKAGGGSKMPTAMAQGTFDIGFGGLAAVAFSIDKGTKMKLISPLHSKGDMLVVSNKIKVNNWSEFVEFVKNRKEPLKLGFKAPKAIALLILQNALKSEGIKYSTDAGDRSAKILLVNMKGAKNLNPGLSNEIIDAYVCNNPFCALAEEKGIGRSIAELNDLPPGLWKDHPCCIIGAMENVISEKRASVVKFLELMTIATDYINKDPNIAVRSASQWIGTTISAEEKSIPTSMYLTEPNQKWLEGTNIWMETMDELGHIKGRLHQKSQQERFTELLDLALINEARNNVKARKLNH